MERDEKPRVVSWFSCGIASAVAAKLAVARYENLEIVYCDTSRDEHPDNQRFKADVERWIDRPIRVIANRKGYQSIFDVFEKERYIAGPWGAKCTVEMKKVPRFDYQRPDDVNVFGYTVEEEGRIARFEKQNPELSFSWILYEAGLTKADCFRIVAEAGIDPPEMYRLGFPNANCMGCVKVQSVAYWQLVRIYWPDRFNRYARIERELNAAIIRVQRNGKRVKLFLDELPRPNGVPKLRGMAAPECGVLCATN